MFIFDAIGFLIAGFLKIMFWIVVTLGIFLIPIFLVGFGGWLAFTYFKDGFMKGEWNSKSLFKSEEAPLPAVGPPPPLPPPPPREPSPPRDCKLEAITGIWKEIGPLVPEEPWRSLFLSVVTELAKAEDITVESLEDHKVTIVSALRPFTQNLPTISQSPLLTPLFSQVADLTRLVQDTVIQQ